MATTKQSYRELRTKLDELMTWFEGEDLDVDEALKKHAEAEKVIKDLEEYLIQTEQKIKKIHIDPEYVDLDDIEQLERWVEDAVKDAIQESQKIAAEKMQPMMGALGNLGM